MVEHLGAVDSKISPPFECKWLTTVKIQKISQHSKQHITHGRSKMLSVVVVVTRSSLQKSLTLADLLFNALTAYFNELYTAQRTKKREGER